MRALFVTCERGDYMSSVLWDGLNELLGSENVRDAAHSPQLHPAAENMGPNTNIGRHPGATNNYLEDSDGDFDLMVVIDAFLCDYNDWRWPSSLRARLRPGGKIAYVISLDPVDHEPLPTFPVDAVFRRELALGRSYRLPSRSMPLAAPLRWFAPPAPEDTRDIDVFLSGNPSSHARWETAAQMFRTQKKHRSLGATVSVIPYDSGQFFGFLRRSKLVLCPPGAGDESMCFWEALANQAIPVHVGHAPRVRDPWFSSGQIFTCSTEELPALLDRELEYDLSAMRARLYEHAIKHHTTKARAETLLRAVGLL